MYFTGKVHCFTSKIHCAWNRDAADRCDPTPNKRYISGYVTGGLQNSDVTRDASRVTHFERHTFWEINLFLHSHGGQGTKSATIKGT
jgi:hypothetical protein